MKQKGFTILELLLALAVSGILLTGAVMGIHQIAWGTDRSNSQVVALTDAEQAAFAITKDLMVTQETSLVDGSPVLQSSVNLTWIDYTGFSSSNSTSHSSKYTLAGTELRRNYDGTESIVSRHITYLGFTQEGRFVNVVITSTGPGVRQRSETLEFSVLTRAEEILD